MKSFFAVDWARNEFSYLTVEFIMHSSLVFVDVMNRVDVNS